MSIRPIALCFGLALTPGFAVTAHATYDVTVPCGPGRRGPRHASAAALPIGNDTEIARLYGASERLNRGGWI